MYFILSRNYAHDLLYVNFIWNNKMNLLLPLHRMHEVYISVGFTWKNFRNVQRFWVGTTLDYNILVVWNNVCFFGTFDANSLYICNIYICVCVSVAVYIHIYYVCLCLVAYYIFLIFNIIYNINDFLVRIY